MDWPFHKLQVHKLGLIEFAPSNVKKKSNMQIASFTYSNAWSV